MMKKVLLFFCILIHFAQQLTAQTAAVPDPAFLTFLKTQYPFAINSSNQLIISQAATINGDFDCSELGIISLEGLQYFTNIQFVHANDNIITYIPEIPTLTKIETFDIQGNKLTTLPALDNQVLVKKIFVSNNQLIKLPALTNNLQLQQLIAFSNLLDSLPPINHLINLNKIDVGNNKLKKLPDMSGLIKMEQLLIWENLLDSIPDLKNYPDLWRINAGGNKLAYTPDLSLNPRLKILFLDRNQLQTLPDLSLLDSLDNVRLQSNNLDFQDLAPILDYPGKDTIFTYSPQNNFTGGMINIATNDSLIIPSGISSYATTTYKWYLNGTLKYTSNQPLLKSFPGLSGDYYVSASSSAFPGLVLKTDLFHVTSGGCLDLSGITFEIDGINCLKAGELWINSTSLPTGDYSYSLSGMITHKQYQSVSGRFKNLNESDYTLTISNETCSTVYPSAIHIPSEECSEAFITPNGDNDKDSYFFNQTGNAVIYDKQGRKIKTIDLPGEWDGTGSDGKLVPQGYYVSTINDGEELVSISVIY